MAPSPKKAPGPDEISFAVLRALWPVINGVLHRLAARCISIGHMPTAFKASTLVGIRKPGKRDPAQPRSWRLIALQQCLGKVLEKIVARRVTFIAATLNLVPSEQYGSMPGRSAVDAGVALRHDIECGWHQAEQRTTVMFNYDIQGAYDAVLPVVLVIRLYHLGLPLSLIRFVWSMVLQRSIAVRLDGTLGAAAVSSRGIPQGSPLSPILFLLYMAPLWQLFGPGPVRWSEQGVTEEELAISDEEREACRQTTLAAFVDDNSLRTSGTDHAQCVRRLQLAFGVALRWCQANGLSVDPVKRELIYFAPPRLRQQPQLPLQTGTAPDTAVQPVPFSGSVRWLGILFDPKLTFAAHTAQAAASARRAAGCLSMLGNTIRGMRAVDLRRLHLACVRPLLLWASPVWWWGRSHRDGTRRYITGSRAGHRRDGAWVHTSGSAGMLHALDVVQNRALRAVLPVYRTTPVTALQYESSVPPVEIALNQATRRYAARLWTLPDAHPLLLRLGAHSPPPAPVLPQLLPPGHLLASAGRRVPVGPALTLDSSAAAQSAGRSFTTVLLSHASYVEQPLERLAALAWSPWHLPLCAHPRITVSVQGRDEAITTHRRLSTEALQHQHVLAYSDASLSGEARGVGILVQRGAALQLRSAFSVIGAAEIFDLEAQGLLAAFCHAVVIARRCGSTHIFLFTDNQSVARSALGLPRGSSQPVFLQLQLRVREWLAEADAHHLTLAWIPGHLGIAGNEQADALARAGARGAPGSHALSIGAQTTSSFRRLARTQAVATWACAWTSARANHPHYAQFRRQDPSLRPSRDLSLPRQTLGRLISARTGHGDFAAYHLRFNHRDASLHCRCGARSTPEHLLLCPHHAQHQHHLRNDVGPMTVPDILDSRRGTAAFATYVHAILSSNATL